VIDTRDLVSALVADAKPVRRLRPPLVRAASWLLLSASIFALLALAHGARPDLEQRLAQPEFVVGIAASLLTGVLAAATSFMLNMPDRSRTWILLPVPAFLTWIGVLGHGCLTNWVSIGPAGLQLGETARCFATLLITSLPLSLLMFTMLRHGALLRPNLLASSASLAVAAMTATAVSFFHSLDASVMILVWNLGTAALLMALGGLIGSRVTSGVG
jgi:hypothetical protein